jgi:hypothetical protein
MIALSFKIDVFFSSFSKLSIIYRGPTPLVFPIPGKILSIVDSIHENGSQELTRLTVIKKWFQDPNRLSPLSIFIAKRVVNRNRKPKSVDI